MKISPPGALFRRFARKSRADRVLITTLAQNIVRKTNQIVNKSLKKIEKIIKKTRISTNGALFRRFARKSRAYQS
jgi:hypothetical protein